MSEAVNASESTVFEAMLATPRTRPPAVPPTARADLSASCPVAVTALPPTAAAPAAKQGRASVSWRRTDPGRPQPCTLFQLITAL